MELGLQHHYFYTLHFLQMHFFSEQLENGQDDIVSWIHLKDSFVMAVYERYGRKLFFHLKNHRCTLYKTKGMLCFLVENPILNYYGRNKKWIEMGFRLLA